MRTKASRLVGAGGGGGCEFRKDDLKVELGGFLIQLQTREELIMAFHANSISISLRLPWMVPDSNISCRSRR